MARGEVVAVSRSGVHAFSKTPEPAVTLVVGLGVDGDAHLGATVQHRSRVARDPTQANLRQVHLLSAELFEELGGLGHEVRPGEMGENLTTWGVDLLGLPTGAALHIGPDAVVEVTGLRNPCRQIDAFQPGLLGHVVGRDDGGQVVRRAGIMGIVAAGGRVAPGDAIRVGLPTGPHRPLRPV